MIILLSSSKSLNEVFLKKNIKVTSPQFLPKSQELIDILKKKSSQNISRLMNVSKNISDLNYQRFQVWNKKINQQKDYQAIYFFNGSVYKSLEVETLSVKAIFFMQKYLRILSGLYGYLRPLDLIKPYRLEMGVKLENSQGKNLYDFWNQILTKNLIAEKSNFIINLASNEYSNVINFKQLTVPVITPIFKNLKNNKYKIISFWAKQARGSMLHFIAKNQIIQQEQLKLFKNLGYYYYAKDSNDKELVFLRD